MAWVFLVVAGLLETAWSAGLKASSEKPGVLLIAGTGILLTASMVFLALAMRNLPLGVAYPVWTGIGSVGSVALGALVFGERLNPTGIAGAALICLGIVLIGLKSH